MDRPGQSGARPEADLTEALDRLWVRFLPEMKTRVSVLDSAAAAVSQGTLSSADREAAHAAAHKLAGVLGTFGLKRGSDLAHEIEVMVSGEPGPGHSSGDGLAQTVAELRGLIENRKGAS